MIKKTISCALGAAFVLGLALSAAGCSKPTVLETIDSAQIVSYPALFIDGSETKYTDASIGTDTLVYTCNAEDDVTVSLESGDGVVTLSAPESSTAGEIKTVTYTLTAKALGEYTLGFYNGEEKDGSLIFSVRAAYPADPEFDAFFSGTYDEMMATDPSDWGTVNAHDPSMIEVDGVYYVFSTGNNGQPGYQIRRSEDLIHWEYVGQAFSSTTKDLKEVYSALESVYGKEVSNSEVWAPDVVPAQGGGFWLYGSLTGVFGNNYSAIFLAYSDTISGKYKYQDTLVVSGGNWGSTANAIDPQIYYDAEGRMYMAYGSFQGGLRAIELDPQTGERLDGYTYAMYDSREIVANEYYGAKIASTSTVEGPVVAYKRGVQLYSGDILNAAEDASLWTQQNTYFLMGSSDSLSLDYTMRQWSSASPASGFTGNVKTASSFSWKHNESDGRIGYTFFAPGHNDIFQTSDGVDLIVYHSRLVSQYVETSWPHYLFASMYAVNSKGQIVMSPNRYAGEQLRKVTREELLNLSGGNYDYIALGQSASIAFAQEGVQLKEDGTLTVNGQTQGKWVLYGDNYVAFTIGNEEYYGVAMPAWIEAENSAGITISAIGTNGFPFFMNMAF